MDAMKNYSGVFERNCNVASLSARIKYIIYDRISLDYLPSRMIATYVRYIEISLDVLKNDYLFLLVQRFSSHCSQGESTCTYHTDSVAWLRLEHDKVELRTEVAHHFIKNSVKTSNFYAALFE